MSIDALLGAAASLSCALTWAVASLIFGRALGQTSATAVGLGLVKAVIAAPLLVMAGIITGTGVPDAGGHLGLLVLTSVLGLVVADTAYLASLARLGVARGVLLIPLVPVTTAVLARVFLDEQLGVRAVVAGGLTLAGVVLASEPRAPAVVGAPRAPLVGVGVVLAAAYVLSQAGSNVLLKTVLASADALHVATLRLLLGIPMLAVLVMLRGGMAGVRPLLVPARLPVIAFAAVVGTMGGIWLGSIGTQRLPVGIATTLAATTPVWALLLVRLRGEAVAPRAIIGAALAIVGVGLLATGG